MKKHLTIGITQMQPNGKINFLSTNRELIFSSLIILICILLALFFPTRNPMEEITKGILFFIVLPYSYIRFVLKRNMSEFGFNLNDARTGIVWGIINLAASLALFFLLVRFTDFKTNYSISKYAISNFWIFVLYELVFVNISLFVSEFFWRGFVLNVFSRKFRHFSIAIQSLLYILISLFAGSSAWQIAPMAIFSITGGITAYKTKSFLYSYFSELLAIIVLGAYLVHSMKAY